MEEVIKNNLEINKLIQKIISERKVNKFSIEENGILNKKIQEIFQYELEKCLAIYELEFPEYSCQGKKQVNLVETKNGHADCSGGVEGLGITKGMQKFLDDQIVYNMKKLGYAIDDKGEPYFDYDLSKNVNHDSANMEYTLEYNYVGSKKDQMDYFAKLFATTPLDMTWITNAIPHEAMHTFGTSASTAFMKEGFTEELTREICQKYKIYMTPTSHTQEAEFVRKLELVVGRDNVINAAMWGQKFKKENFKEILENNPQITYNELSYIFTLLKYDEKKLSEEPALKQYFDNFSKENLEIINTLEEKAKLYDEENSKGRYKEIAKEFETNLNLKEGTFYKYIDILDNCYNLTAKYNKDPKWYRDIYNLNMDELKDDYTLFNQKKLQDSDKEILSNIEGLFNQIAVDNNMQIDSFEDLMGPLNEYIKDKKLDIDEDIEKKDYSSVLQIQQKEISFLKEYILAQERFKTIVTDNIKDTENEVVNMDEVVNNLLYEMEKDRKIELHNHEVPDEI